MLIQLNTISEIPIYVQLRNQIVLGIGSGQLKIGEKLPSVRSLAEDIGVNTMTVNKAYTILKNEGFIEIDRRKGAQISPVAKEPGRYREKMEEELKLLISESSLKGIPKEDFLKRCNELFYKLAIVPC